jgi:hypothetical protein
MTRTVGLSLLLIFCLLTGIPASSRRSVIFDPSRAGVLEFKLLLAPEFAEDEETVYSVNLSGTHVKKNQDVSPSTTVVFEALPEDLYFLKIRRGKEKIYQFSLLVRRRRTTTAELFVKGVEHRPDKKQHFYCYHSLSGGDLQGRKKTVYEDWSKTEVANGDVEYEKSGFNFVLNKLGLSHFKPETLPVADDYALIMGLAQLPFITGLHFTNLTERKRGTRAENGDILLLESFVESCGGPAVSAVQLNIFQHGQHVLHYDLLDDASLTDLGSEWPGRQISGDLQKGDNIFSRLVPVSSQIRELLSDSMWVFTVQNTAGKEGNYYIEYMQKEEIPLESMDFSGSSFAFSRLEYHSLPTLAHFYEAGGRDLSLRFVLPEKMFSYVLNGTDKVIIYPVAEDEGNFFYDHPLRIKQKEIFLLVIVDNSGQIYYTGEVF